MAVGNIKSIYQQSIDLKLDVNKFIFLDGDFFRKYNNREFIVSVLGKDIADIVDYRTFIIRHDDSYSIPINQFYPDPLCPFTELDYIRIRIFDFLVKEIKKKNLVGAVAELGVLKGEFSKCINRAFPKSELFLFDTFDGFDKEEAASEIKQGHCNEIFVKKYTSVNKDIDIVMEKMTYPDKVIIKKGLFPDSLDGLEENFIFVSIDVDFEKSTYAALEYFYPRLVSGGYIMLHDYNSHLKGVENAVNDYEKAHGSICKVPVCDAGSTLVITK